MGALTCLSVRKQEMRLPEVALLLKERGKGEKRTHAACFSLDRNITHEGDRGLIKGAPSS